MKVAESIFWIIICVGCSTITPHSTTPTTTAAIEPMVYDQIPTSNETVVERRLPGSATSLTNALGATDLVFIGRVARVGIPESDSPGFTYYSLDIDVEHVLRGSVGAKFRSGVSVRLFPIDQVESVPTVGSHFIFLISRQDTEVLKMLYPTAANKLLCSRTPLQ